MNFSSKEKIIKITVGNIPKVEMLFLAVWKTIVPSAANRKRLMRVIENVKSGSNLIEVDVENIE
jgi:hypothetical protein